MTAPPGPVGAHLTAPAKLTVSLRVVGRRDDGYHLIDAEMVSLSLADRLELRSGRGVSYEGAWAPSDGWDTDGVVGTADDLVSRALSIVGDPAVAVTVAKRIPAGAGLGGGSADAAAILRWAGVTDPLVAVRLGADVPFCVSGGSARVRGIGEIVEPIEHRERRFTLLTPPIHCSSAEVYRRWDELGGPDDPLEEGNDLTVAALDRYPELRLWRDEIEQATGQRARLAGSGSTWFVPGHHRGEALVRVVTVPSGWQEPQRTGVATDRAAD